MITCQTATACGNTIDHRVSNMPRFWTTMYSGINPP